MDIVGIVKVFVLVPDKNIYIIYMKFVIVLARYNEDIKWSKQFPNVIVYNKGYKLTDKVNEVLLSNVGREGHTYYKYIYDNYENLADYTIFLQGTPFDHSPNIISNLNKIINHIDELDFDFAFLSEQVYCSNLNGCCHHPNLPLIDTYEKIFGKRIENLDFTFGAGAQFIVSKTNILKKPKEFYLKIVELLQHSINPTEGYVIERFHKLILE